MNIEDLQDQIEHNGKQYKKVPCYGSLKVAGETYLLLKPSPVPGFDSWIKNERAFYVVPEKLSSHISERDLPLYGYPLHVIVSGNWYIKLRTSRIYVRMFDNEMETLAEQFTSDGHAEWILNYAAEHDLIAENPEDKNE